MAASYGTKGCGLKARSLHCSTSETIATVEPQIVSCLLSVYAVTGPLNPPPDCLLNSSRRQVRLSAATKACTGASEL